MSDISVLIDHVDALARGDAVLRGRLEVAAAIVEGHADAIGDG